MLRNGRVRSCECVKIAAREVASFNDLVGIYKRSAIYRGYKFDISTAFIKKITKMECAYCGIEPRQCHSAGRLSDDYTYNGVDRVDNSKGYTEENVVPCCKTCNIAKNNMPLGDFLAWVERVYRHSIEGKK